MSKDKKYKILEKTDPKNSVVDITVELEKDFVDSFREETISDLKKDVEIDGFRKGNAPESKVLEKVGELSVLEKNTFKAINTIVPIIIQDEGVNAITMPNISIVKLAPGVNPEIKISLTLMPEVELADYKKVAEGVEKPKDTDATDEEVDQYINHLLESRAHAGHNHKPGEKCDAEKPELNDEFVKTLGEFKNVDDFKKQLKENITRDKVAHLSQKRRIEIMEKVIADSKIQMPDILIEEEQERMLHEFRAKVESFKMNFEEYLKEIKKTEEELKNEWKADAEKRAKMNLILPKIARAEKLKAEDKDIEDEVKKIKEQYKDIDENVAKVYVTNVLTNQKVFDFLDNL